MSGYLVTFGSQASSAIEEVVITKVERRLLGTTRDTWTDVPGREGAVLFPEKRGMRTVVCSCLIVAGAIADRHGAVEELADWLDTSDQRRLIIGDRPDRYWWAKLAEPPDVDEWRSMAGSGLGFPLAFTALPYAYSVDLSTRSFSASGGTGTDTWTPPDGVDTYPVIEITAVGGTIAGFDLEVNGDTLVYSGTVTSGNKVTVSSISNVLYAGANQDTALTGDLDYSAITMADVSGSFGTLQPGSNTVTFTNTAGTATSATVAITWRRRYR